MDLYNLGKVSWQDSQLLYHALAHLGREALMIVQPGDRYVCIGYHQDAEREVEVDYLRAHDIPLFRREVGGGAVYLDEGQLFYQFVLRADRDDVPKNKDQFYRKYLGPVVQTNRDFGVDAEFKPVNDIIVGGRKISGNGAGEIGGMAVLVGNFILDFNYEMMSRVLRVPDEKFRDKVYKTLEGALSTLKRELGEAPTIEQLSERLIEHCEPLLGRFTPRGVDDELRAMADRLWEEQFSHDEWTLANDLRRRGGRDVKIASGVHVVERVFKAPGGLIRATAVQREDRLYDVHLSGDFFLFPADSLADLETALEGVSAEAGAIEARITGFYASHAVETPGVTPHDFAVALVGE
jgi:lipoate-protein ligase A